MFPTFTELELYHSSPYTTFNQCFKLVLNISEIFASLFEDEVQYFWFPGLVNLRTIEADSFFHSNCEILYRILKLLLGVWELII